VIMTVLPGPGFPCVFYRLLKPLDRAKASTSAEERNCASRKTASSKSGGDNIIAIDVTGETEGVVIVNNELKETRSPASRIGIRIGAQTRDTRCADNRIEGFATEIADLGKKQARKHGRERSPYSHTVNRRRATSLPTRPCL